MRFWNALCALLFTSPCAVFKNMLISYYRDENCFIEVAFTWRSLRVERAARELASK